MTDIPPAAVPLRCCPARSGQATDMRAAPFTLVVEECRKDGQPVPVEVSMEVNFRLY